MVYQLKYRGVLDAADQVAAAMFGYLSLQTGLPARIDLIVPMPPSVNRTRQPVFEIGTRLAALLGKPFEQNAIRKLRETSQLKDVHDPTERQRLLTGAFAGEAGLFRGMGVLLIDDLYRSGETAKSVTQAIMGAGAREVHFLAATRTRGSA